MTRYISKQDYARRIGRTTKTVERQLEKRKIPGAYKDDRGRWLIPIEEPDPEPEPVAEGVQPTAPPAGTNFPAPIPPTVDALLSMVAERVSAAVSPLSQDMSDMSRSVSETQRELTRIAAILETLADEQKHKVNLEEVKEQHRKEVERLNGEMAEARRTWWRWIFHRTK